MALMRGFVRIAEPLCVVAWLAAACSGGGRAPASVARDSAGVVIVESTEPSWTPGSAWKVESPPLLDLSRSGSGPEYEFFRVVHAALLPDGGIVVANRGAGEVRFFDSAGTFRATVGRFGDGPGEFQRLRNVAAYSPDSVVAFDYWANRATVIGTRGSLGRVITLDLPRYTRANELYSIPGEGFLLLMMRMDFAQMRGLVWIPGMVTKATVDGVITDTIVHLKGSEIHVYEGGNGSLPWPRQSRVAVHNGDVYVCDSERLEYMVLSQNGMLRRVVRVPTLNLDVPDRIMDSVRAMVKQHPLRRAIADELPTTYPSCSEILVDALGYVWLEHYHHPYLPSDEPRNWLIFSPEGTWLGRLSFPTTFEIFEVDASRILGLARDSLDVESVQVLQLNRR